MSATNLSFAKVVATPTASSWSQAYNAGALFIVLSLTTEDEELKEKLPTQGKQILNNVEAEFFILEEKSLKTIKHAITQACKDMLPAIAVSLTLAFIKDNVLYGFVFGSGKITLKRGDKVGTILNKQPLPESDEIQSASGYLEPDDIILLQTHQFAKSVPAQTITQAFELTIPNDIAETISPHVHNGSEGGASAIIISYKGSPRVRSDEADSDILSPSQAPLHHAPQTQIHEREDEETRIKHSLISHLLNLFPRPTRNIQLDRQKKLILGLAIIIFGILLVSIFLVRSSEKANKTRALFEEIYKSAKKDYDEGEALLSLNKSLARDDYLSSKATLAKAQGKFKPGSEEAKKIEELAKLIDKRLAETEGITKVSVKEAPNDAAPVLALLQKESSLVAVAEDEGAFYTLSDSAVVKITKATGKKEQLIKNEGDWTQAVSLGVFSGNVYILDQKKGLLKFVPTASGMSQIAYFKDEAPKLDSAISLAIDSSIYILFSNGSIEKFTRGIKDSFTVSGLKKPFSKPTSLFAAFDMPNIYVLDVGDARLVKLDTSGNFQAEYQTPILKDARAFTISPDEKAAYVLSGGKIYQVNF